MYVVCTVHISFLFCIKKKSSGEWFVPVWFLRLENTIQPFYKVYHLPTLRIIDLLLHLFVPFACCCITNSISNAISPSNVNLNFRIDLCTVHVMSKEMKTIPVKQRNEEFYSNIDDKDRNSSSFNMNFT